MDRQRASCCGMAGKREFYLLASLVVLLSCTRNEPTSEPGQAVRPPDDTLQESLLPEEEITAIRAAIEQCGGTIRLDIDRQPIAVDLAAERGSADLAGLQSALACPRLKSLRIRAAGLREDDLAGVQGLVSLEELFLQDVPIGDAFLENTLNELTALRRLTLRNTPDVTDLSPIARLPKLTHLALIDMPIVSKSLRPLIESSTLVALDLRMCGQIGGEELAVLAEIPKLEQLQVGGYAIDNSSMLAVASIANLKSLTIEDASIDADGLAELSPVALGLHSLSLARCSGLTDDSLRAVEIFTNLRTLLLRDVPVTGEFLQHIAAPEQLETLALNQTFLADQAFDAIVACRNLKRLELSRNFLDSGSIQKITALEHLEYLDLAECGLNDESLIPLKNMVNLRTLIVEGNPDVSDQAVQRILGTLGAG